MALTVVAICFVSSYIYFVFVEVSKFHKYIFCPASCKFWKHGRAGSTSLWYALIVCNTDQNSTDILKQITFQTRARTVCFG